MEKIKARTFETDLKRIIVENTIEKMRDKLMTNVQASIPPSILNDPPISIDVTYSASPAEGKMEFKG